MIEVVCDKCGKRIVLEHDEVGLKSPKGWNMITQYFPTDREVRYKTFCPECRQSMKRVKE